MNRDNVLAVRLTETERKVVEALAEAEKIPASTLARRQLLLRAEQCGIVLPFVENQNRAVLQDMNAVLA